MNRVDLFVRILLIIMLFLSSIKDIKTKSVSMRMVIPCLLIVLFCLPFRNDITIISGLLGSFVGFIMIGIGKVSNWQVGMGDGIVLVVTGIGLGIWENAFLLLYALLLISVFCVFLLFIKKISKKNTLPFIPFLFIGYIVVTLT